MAKGRGLRAEKALSTAYRLGGVKLREMFYDRVYINSPVGAEQKGFYLKLFVRNKNNIIKNQNVEFVALGCPRGKQAACFIFNPAHMRLHLEGRIKYYNL